MAAAAVESAAVEALPEALGGSTAPAPVFNDSGQIEQAPISKLIDMITEEDEQRSDPTYAYDLILGYSYFIDAADLLHRLLEKCHVPLRSRRKQPAARPGALSADHARQRRVVRFIEKWVDVNFDFRQDEALVDELLSHLDAIKGQQDAEFEETVARLCHKIIMTEDVDSAMGPSLPAVSLNKFKRRGSMFGPKGGVDLTSTASMLQYEPGLLARQITLLESEVFLAIKPRECLRSLFREAPDKAPNFVALKQRFNKTTGWVAATIVQIPEMNKRVQVICAFIEIASECARLNSFNAVMSITGGLRINEVSRLKKTWAKVPAKMRAAFEEFSTWYDSHFKKYHAAVAAADPPLVPFIGYYEDLLVRTEFNNETHLRGMANFTKCRMMGRLLRDLQQYQRVPYYFDPVPEIRDFLTSVETLKSSELFHFSTQIEPTELNVPM